MVRAGATPLLAQPKAGATSDSLWMPVVTGSVARSPSMTGCLSTLTPVAKFSALIGVLLIDAR